MIKMLQKIISGGQTGADRGGLEAGAILGTKTGGTAPLNFMTENGSDESLKRFGLIEGEYDFKIYPKRTIKNIEDSDGTVWFGNKNSRGGILTIKTAYRLLKFVIINPTPNELYNWLNHHNISILNVAGNRESKNKGIADLTKNTIISAVMRMFV